MNTQDVCNFPLWPMTGLLVLGCVLFGATQVNAQTSGLVAAYAFDEGSGTAVADLSGSGNTGTVSGATWTTSGRYGKALTFNGTGAYVNVPDSNSLDLTTGMTLEAWVYPTALSNWRTVLIKQRPAQLSYALYANSDTNRPSAHVYLATDIDTRGTSQLPLNSWTHLAATYSGSQLRLYVNAVLQSTRAVTGSAVTSANPLRIGGNSVWGEYFSGRIDEIRVYNRALAQSAVQLDMNTPVGTAPPPPDTTPPTVTTFTLPSTSASLTVGITNYTATDTVGVTAYLLTESAAQPLAADPGWLSLKPVSYTFATAGARTLYAWAKDAAGNVSTSLSADVTITLPDTVPPTVTAFTLPGTADSLTVGILSYTATDTVGVTGYLLTESATQPSAGDPGWLTIKPVSYTFATAGAKTLYAWAKDAAGNVSTSLSATVTIAMPDTVPPTVTAFTLPSMASSLTVGILSYTATDTVGVTAYLLTETAAQPTAGDPGWLTVKPASYTFAAAGAKMLYAWAKDAAGNVSTSLSAAVTITLPDTRPPFRSNGSPSGQLPAGTAQATLSLATDEPALCKYSSSPNISYAAMTSAFATTGGTSHAELLLNLSNGTTYRYYIKCRDTYENANPDDYVVSFEVLSPPLPPSGLVAAYAFDEGSGTAVADLSGSGNAGTVSGATWTTSGRYGKALTFNGTSAYVNVADSNSLDLTTGMTLEAWVYPTALSNWRTVLIKQRPAQLSYALYANSDTNRPSAHVYLATDIDTRGTSQLPLNSWTHLAATFDGSQLKIYANGVLQSTKAAPGSAIASTNPLRIGGNSVWGEYFSGRIDEIRVYRRALAQSEIQLDMTTPLGTVPPPVDTTPPDVTVTNPPSNATVAGTATLTATATDNVAVAGVQFTVDQSDLGPEDMVAPYEASWDSSAVADGTHAIAARARDTSGNTRTSAAVSVTTANAASVCGNGALEAGEQCDDGNLIPGDGCSSTCAREDRKNIYIALDDHTDYFWTADSATYQTAFLNTLDFYLDQVTLTQNDPAPYQSRFNADGSYWMWVYQHYRTPAQFQKLIDAVKSGHISVAKNSLVVTYGGQPAEAVLRGMYYAGQIERDYATNFPLAMSVENAGMPFGLSALWAGSGVKYSWKGVCRCDGLIPDLNSRDHEIYWSRGSDGSDVLVKWNSLLTNDNTAIGGYAEARRPAQIVNYVDTDAAFIQRYPYRVIGAFGYGWDDLQTSTTIFPGVAAAESDQDRAVIVSNEVDFFEDFSSRYGASLPAVSASFGNEWDLYAAAMAEQNARMKRGTEKLRTAEGLAAMVSLKDPALLPIWDGARQLAANALGSFWEHNMGMVYAQTGSGGITKRIAWQKQLASNLEYYVDGLAADAAGHLGGMIGNPTQAQRFFVFNPLSWSRTDVADLPYSNADVHVVDVTTGEEVPSQFVALQGQTYLRALASNVPALGYKVFEIRQGAGAVAFGEAASVTGATLANEYYSLTLTPGGAISSLLDLQRGGRQFASLIGGRYLNDMGGTAGTIRVENAGPVSVTLVADATSPLAHTTRVTLFRGSGRIDIQNEITQNFDATYTFSYGLNLSAPVLRHEEVGAIITARLTSNGGSYSPRNARYDWLTLNHFADMSGGGLGVTLSSWDNSFMSLGNSTPYVLDTATPRISVLVGGRVANGASGDIRNQAGDSYFLQRFALRTHDAYNQAGAMKFSLEHQNPFVAGMVTGGSDYPEGSFSLLTVSNGNVAVWAVKAAEEGIASGVIVRVWNLDDTAASFALDFAGRAVARIVKTTHVETDIEDLAPTGGALQDTLAPQQIKTYRIFLSP